MPHFSESGNDTYICQKCTRVFDSVKYPPVWSFGDGVPRGNICPNCRRGTCMELITDDGKHAVSERRAFARDKRPISLHEHCRRESGLTGMALERYVQRHYGHG